MWLLSIGSCAQPAMVGHMAGPQGRLLSHTGNSQSGRHHRLGRAIKASLLVIASQAKVFDTQAGWRS